MSATLVGGTEIRSSLRVNRLSKLGLPPKKTFDVASDAALSAASAHYLEQTIAKDFDRAHQAGVTPCLPM